MPTDEIRSSLRGLLNAALADTDQLPAVAAELRELADTIEKLASMLGPPPGKSAGRTGDPGPARTPRATSPNGDLRTERRLRVVRLLLDRGPLMWGEVAKGADIPAGSLAGVLKCPWFSNTDRGWVATEEGMAATRGSSAATVES